jgi:lysine 2,3-aminomutase
MSNLSNNEQEIAHHLSDSATKTNWADWKWQLKHTIKSLDQIETILGIKYNEKDKKELQETVDKFPLSVTPYYLSLIDREDWANDPIYKQSIPVPSELIVPNYDMLDPLAEDKDSPTSSITHRYPDRVLFNVSNVCSMYCRHCTRKRRVGDKDQNPDREILKEGFKYISENQQIRDVLLSGGDPLLLSDEMIDWILSELRSIKHVEVIRIGTRTPVVLPFRITDELIKILQKHTPVWVNTHFNHPREITSTSRKSIAKLANAGIPLGNQSVLLAGVNDCPRIMKSLCHKLVYNRIRPYYLYQCDLSEGLSHFRTPVGKGIEIMEALIGHTSGFAVPTYVIDAPGGGGKIPVMPNYLISWSTNKVVLRNYEGVITTYKEPDSYEPIFCDRNCSNCNLQLNLADSEEHDPIGIEKLLSDYDSTIAFVPSENERVKRRSKTKE